jgi:tight adherence protein C
VTILLLTGLALTGLTCVLLLRSFSLARSRQRETLSQIQTYGFVAPTAPTAPRDIRALAGSTAAAVGGLVVRRIDPEREKRIRRQLDAAGLYRTSVASFLGYRLLAVGGAAIFTPLVLDPNGVRGVLVVLWVTWMAWFVPSYVVKRRARIRREQVDREVPELVDLLVTTVEAGVAFAGGLQLAARSIKGPLGDELRLSLQEQNLGLSPEEALSNLGKRVDSPALRAFTQALIQGEALGVSIGKILRDLAVDMRKRRRQAAEERAQKTPTKILFPLVTLILPAMFIVTLGPVLARVKDFFG